MAIFSKTFWKDALERSISTGAQSIIVGLGLDQVDVVSLVPDFKTIASLFVAGFIVAIIKAVAAAQIGDSNSASLIE